MFDLFRLPGLLYANSYVYIAFSMIDGYASPYPNGAVFGYNTANLSATPLYFQTSLGGDPNSTHLAGRRGIGLRAR